MKTIRFDREQGVGHIVLANPPHNYLDKRFCESLANAIHEASESDVRVVLVRAEGPNFSFGGEVREWPGKDVNWFRTFVAEVNQSYRALEALRVPTVAAVAIFRCVEVTTGMLPIAGALQRLAERAGRTWASRWAMLGEPITGALAGQLGIVSHVVAEAEVAAAAKELAQKLATGPTRSYAATRALLKAWSAGGVPLADAMMLDVTIDLYLSEDCTRGFLSTAKAFDQGIEPPAMIFNGR